MVISIIFFYKKIATWLTETNLTYIILELNNIKTKKEVLSNKLKQYFNQATYLKIINSRIKNKYKHNIKVKKMLK